MPDTGSASFKPYKPVGTMNSSTESAVFLVHGFRSDSSSVGQMARLLGLRNMVIPVDLPITFENLNRCVDQLRGQVERAIDKYPVRRINFVGHSTGGLVIRMLLRERWVADKTAACVFVAVPNKGTVLANFHQTFVPAKFRDVHKPVAQLTKRFIESLELECPAHVAFGGIAGLRSWPGSEAIFDGPNDGVVAVSSVYLDEMVDFVRVPGSHVTIMDDFATITSVSKFIETFCFPAELKGLTG